MASASRLFGLAVAAMLGSFPSLPSGAAEAPPPRKRTEVEAILRQAPQPSPAKPLRVLLVAGPKDHGPGEHDYPKWQKDWSALLQRAPGVEIRTAFPWPTEDQWKDVDLAVFYLKTKWDAAQLAQVRRHQEQGRGMVTIHWAIGCDQEWERHAECVGLSYRSASYRHGAVNLKLSSMNHPVLRGLPASMPFVDEPYWPFIGDANRVQVLATSDEQIYRGDDRRNNPGDATVKTVPVFWTFEPSGTSARVFVSIFGHYMWTFDDPLFRLMLLRGMAWAAKADPYRWDALAVDGVTLAE